MSEVGRQKREVLTWIRQAISFLGLAFLVSLFIGADCSESGATCEECPAGQVRSCTEQCHTPVPIGGTCSTNPCAENGTCVSGATCVSLFNTTRGSCVNLGYGLGSLCYPNADFCPTGLYCRPPTVELPHGGTKTCHSSATAVCALPVRDGGRCDSDFDHPLCSPCQPGETCVDGRCHKPCTTNADCPCGKNQSCTGRGSPNVEPNLCYSCKYFGDTGCDTETPCCDDSTCSDGRCCRSRGARCSTKADCCNSSDICLGGTCRACKQKGETCSTGSECCSGLRCDGGRCILPCNEGAPCSTGKPGVCAAGTIQCDGLGNASCIQTHQPSPEVCDGLDNDCDGIVDNIQSEPCTKANHYDSSCQGGFESPGRTECRNGQTVCVAKAGRDYCNQCGGSGVGDELFCGACQYCGPPQSAQLCGPNKACQFPAGSSPTCQEHPGCPYKDYEPACWLPSQNGQCVAPP